MMVNAMKKNIARKVARKEGVNRREHFFLSSFL